MKTISQAPVFDCVTQAGFWTSHEALENPNTEEGEERKSGKEGVCSTRRNLEAFLWATPTASWCTQLSLESASLPPLDLQWHREPVVTNEIHLIWIM